MSRIANARSTPTVNAFMCHEDDLKELVPLAKAGDAEAAAHVRAVKEQIQAVKYAPDNMPRRCISCGCELPGELRVFAVMYTLPEDKAAVPATCEVCAKCVYTNFEDGFERATELFETAHPDYRINWQSIPRPTVPPIPQGPVPEKLTLAEIVANVDLNETFKNEASGFINLFLYRGRAIFDLVAAAQKGDMEALFHIGMVGHALKKVKSRSAFHPVSCAFCSCDFIASSLVTAAAVPANRDATAIWPILLCDGCGDGDETAVRSRVSQIVTRAYPKAHLAWPPFPSAANDLEGCAQ